MNKSNLIMQGSIACFKSAKNNLRISLCFIIFSFVNVLAFGQATAPATQSLPYSQDFSSLAHASSTYPAGWQGHTISTSYSGAFRTTPPTANSILLPSFTAAAIPAGIHNYNGKIGFLSSSSTDQAICLAINTTGVSNVQVRFDMMTIRNPYDGVGNSIIDQVDLQYQLGSISGTWISVSGNTNGIYQNNTTTQNLNVTTPQNLQSIQLILPAICNNEASVYLRWVQRYVSGSFTTTLPSFAVDNINICTAPIINPVGPTAICIGTSVNLTASATVPNNAVQFDGINDYVNIPQVGLTTNQITIEFWFKRTNSGSAVEFLTSNALEKLEIHVGGIGSNAIRFIPTTGIYFDSESNIFTPGSWTHLACVYDNTATPKGKIYVNGVSVDSIRSGTNTTNPAISITNLSNIILGNRQGGTLPFKGMMDEVRIWNTARTQSQIQASMNQVVASNSPGLINYCKLDEGIGTSTSNLVAGYPAGGLVNGTLWQAASNAQFLNANLLWSTGATSNTINVTATANYSVSFTNYLGCNSTTSSNVTVNQLPDPKITASGSTSFCQGDSLQFMADNTSLQFDGVDDFVSVPASEGIDSLRNKVTLEMWFKRKNTGAAVEFLIAKEYETLEIHIGGIGSNSIKFIPVPGVSFDSPPNIFTSNEWTHLACVYDATAATGKIYINGVDIGAVKTGPNPASTLISTIGSTPLRIAQRNDVVNYPFRGAIGEVRIWNTARTQAQIQASMNTLVLINAPGLVTYCKLDEGVGTTIINSVAGTSSGTLLNGPVWSANIASYLWSTGATTQNITVNASGNYSFTITDVNGCSSVSSPKFISVNALPPKPIIDFSQLIINESFDDISTLTSSGWVQKNNSQPIGASPNWIQGSPHFSANSGMPNAYISVGFASVAGDNTISNWLIAPMVTLNNCDTVSFWTRTKSPVVFPDRLQLRMSTNGASVNVGSLNSDVGDFTSLLLDINPTLSITDYPNVWTKYTYIISGLTNPVLGRLAFRYFVINGGTGANSFIIGVDDFSYKKIQPVICSGQSITLATSSGGTYLWSNGETSASTIVSPSSNSTYTVTVTNASNCSSVSTPGAIIVDVPFTPIITGSTIICSGQSTSLSTSGGGTYLWSNGATTSSITISPISNTNYSVTVTNANNCSSVSAPMAIIVNVPVTPIITGDTIICIGQPTTLTTSGGGSYLWSNGASTSSIIISPISNTNYTVTVTNANNCSAVSLPISVTTFPLTLWFADADGDNFGSLLHDTLACGQPSGFVANNTDCDDINPLVNPFTEEICGNLIDDNCNGQIDENNALAFDGVDDFVNVPAIGISGTDFTIELWVKKSASTYLKSVFTNNSFNNGAVHLSFYDNLIWLGIAGNNPQDFDLGSIVDGVWNHIAIVYSGAISNVKCYINGTLSTSKNYFSVNPYLANIPGRIGGWDEDASRNFSGAIDEFRIWNVVRSQALIKNFMFGGLSMPLSGLLTYYKFDNGISSGSNTAISSIADASNHNKTGTLNNFNLTNGNTNSNFIDPAISHYQDLDGDGYGNNAIATTQFCSSGFVLNNNDCNDTDSLISPGSVEICGNSVDENCNGQIDENSALAFDGVNDKVQFSSRLVPSSGDFTVEFWVNSSADAGNSNFISQGSAGNAFYIGKYSGGTELRCGDMWQSTGVYLPLNQWVHIALVKNGAIGTLYLNAVQVATNTNYSISSSGSNTAFGIQYGGIPEYANTRMDEMRIWNFVRTQAQIKNFMSGGLSFPQMGLVSYYQFDQGIPNGSNNNQTTLMDASGNGNNGMLQNFSLLNGNTISNFIPTGISFYNDLDNDCYGNGPIVSTNFCTSGYVGNNSDCNESDTSIHPNAIEICGDGIDQDCNGNDITAPLLSVAPSSQFSCSGNSIAPVHVEPKTMETANFIQNSFAGNNGIYFDISNTSASEIKVTGMQLFMLTPSVSIPNGTVANYSFYVTTSASTAVGNYTNPAAWTAISNNNITFPISTPSLVYYIDIDFGLGSFTLAPGQSKGMYIVSTTTNPGQFNVVYRTAANLVPTITDSMLTLTSLNSSNGTFQNSGNNRTFNGKIYYQSTRGYSWSRDNTVSLTGANSGNTFPIALSLSNTTNQVQTTHITITAPIAFSCIQEIPVTVIVDSITTWYSDIDGDKYGNLLISSLNCTQPINYVLDHSDCNDADSLINTGSAEVCSNNLDDNCNALIDEGCQLLLNLNLFIEGYYQGGGSMQPALFNSGESTVATDCDSIIVELHDQFNYDLVRLDNVILKTNGTAVVNYPPSILGGTYYIIVRTRNAVETWSKLPVSFNSSIIYFDFTE